MLILSTYQFLESVAKLGLQTDIVGSPEIQIQTTLLIEPRATCLSHRHTENPDLV